MYILGFHVDKVDMKPKRVEIDEFCRHNNFTCRSHRHILTSCRKNIIK